MAKKKTKKKTEKKSQKGWNLKYRPQTFNGLLRRGYTVDALSVLVNTDSLPQVSLFYGPKGCGKTSAARIVAKYSNCLDACQEACGACSSCIGIEGGDDVDVFEINGANKNGVDDARDLGKNMYYRPARSAYKFYIIDEAHMLTKQAQNALLKILEEPPEHIKFILCTTEKDGLLPTILDRCRYFGFSDPDPRSVYDHIAAIFAFEEVKFDQGGLELVIRHAESVRDAIKIAEAVYTECGDVLHTNVIKNLKISYVSNYKMLQGLMENKPANMLEHLHDLFASGFNVHAIITSVTHILRNALVVNALGQQATSYGVSKGEFYSLRKSNYSSNKCTRIISALNNLKINPSDKVAVWILETLFLTFCERKD